MVGAMALSALELQDAATVAFAAELHAVRWGAGMCIAARIARRLHLDHMRHLVVTWLGCMAAECQGARRACSHLALAVDRLADQVAHQQSIIDSLIANVNEADEEKDAVIEQTHDAQKSIAMQVIKRWIASTTEAMMRSALVKMQQAFSNDSVRVARDSARRQRAQEDELSSIKRDCENVHQRLIEAEEIRKQNAEVERKLKKERDEKIREQSAKISELVSEKSTVEELLAEIRGRVDMVEALAIRNEELEEQLAIALQGAGSSLDDDAMQSRIQALEVKNLEVRKECRTMCQRASLGLLIGNMRWWQVELVSWAAGNWYHHMRLDKKTGAWIPTMPDQTVRPAG